METNGYYYFYELCKNGGFSAAAKALYVTQPAVSYAISKLEQQLGVKLIEKGAKKLILTEYGEDLYRNGFDHLIWYYYKARLDSIKFKKKHHQS